MISKFINTTIRSLLLILIAYSSAIAYDDKYSHPHLSIKAVSSSITETYLRDNLGTMFENGLSKTIINNKSVINWIKEGSTSEDDPDCRASNHFHNPMLPWNESQMSDDTTPLAYLIRDYCNNTSGWPYTYRKSNITWATGYLSPSPDGKKYE